MFNTPEVVKSRRLIQVNIGQGEGDTRWNGWPWNRLRFKFDIYVCIRYSKPQPIISMIKKLRFTSITKVNESYFNKKKILYILPFSLCCF